MIGKIFACILVGASASKCPFGYTSSKTEEASGDGSVNGSKASHPRVLQASIDYPSQLFTCTGKTSAQTTPNTFTSDTYEEVVRATIVVFDGLDQELQDKTVACWVRLAGHDFMDFRANAPIKGGSDGCMNFNDPPHKGLPQCVEDSGIKAVYQTYCDTISIADFMIIATEAIMARTASDYNAADVFKLGTLAQKFKSRFRAGRTTVDTCPDNIGKMPNAEQGCASLEGVFVKNMFGQCGDNGWRYTAAISGAHTVGQAKLTNSGFNGFWSDKANQGKFNNDYFRSLLLKGWGPEKAVNGNSGRNQWKRVDSSVELAGHHEFMLNTDICLVYKNKLTGDAFLNAESSKGCCTWTSPKLMFNNEVMKTGQQNDCCGKKITGNEQHNNKWKCDLTFSPGISFGCTEVEQGRSDCCTSIMDHEDCDDPSDPTGPAFLAVKDYAADERLFYEQFVQAWNIATENGFRTPAFDCSMPLELKDTSNMRAISTGILLIILSFVSFY